MDTFNIDIDYLCKKMSDMSGLPIRVFNDDKLENTFSVIPLIIDPYVLYKDDIFSKKENVSFYITPKSDYYGIINSHKLKIVIGPSMLQSYTDQQLKDLAFELNVSAKDYQAFANAIKVIVPMPLDSLIQMMCTLNHVINGEKLNTSDFQVKETQINEKIDYQLPIADNDVYKTYNIENQIRNIVKSGDTNLLQQWVKEVPTIKPGILSSNYIRHLKNTLIVNATLISRTAISAGMDVSDAFKLSDSFILRCENANDINEINSLQYELVYNYTKEVGKIKNLTNNDQLLNEIYYYITHHLSENITTSQIADALFMSRSYLSSLFKQKYSVNLIDYIHKVKIDKAKDLLKDKTKSITQIADYLGYCSSSHFSRVFKQVEHISPKDYRIKK